MNGITFSARDKGRRRSCECVCAWLALAALLYFGAISFSPSAFWIFLPGAQIRLPKHVHMFYATSADKLLLLCFWHILFDFLFSFTLAAASPFGQYAITIIECSLLLFDLKHKFVCESSLRPSIADTDDRPALEFSPHFHNILVLFIHR